jgi:predicted CoA-substrate-specific enzyme activase
MNRRYRMGIDIGSTTAKVVLVDGGEDEIIFSDYRRHHTETLATLELILGQASQQFGEIELSLLVTGSAGMGISETCNLPFIQEVVASAEVVHQRYPQVNTLIDIGGEDAKMIFFDEQSRPDIRMNGNCAGGTGAFIDEMANLLDVSLTELDSLAAKHTHVYSMASRCGVFAKTDLQNLLSRDVAIEDIAASVFNAIVLQTLATLSRGYDPYPAVLFCGGPLTFLSSLRQAFMNVMNLAPDEIQDVENGQFLPAYGAALAETDTRCEISITELIDLLHGVRSNHHPEQHRLKPLFTGSLDFQNWEKLRQKQSVERVDLRHLEDRDCFLGVDSGSTTTKVVLIDERGQLAYDYYSNNHGNAIQAVSRGLDALCEQLDALENPPRVVRSAVTGYGEDLVRAAFGFDEGLVETLAHYRAAKTLDEGVSFILDIGGQDMKAIFVRDGFIQNIEINEACSSGCGSFIQNFAQSMDHSVSEFAHKACASEAPCDLGTRCTVFMNSKVKQAFREGADIADISAGLAYSVIKNALHKVLRLTNTDVLGDHIVVQGGTFKNPAILRAVELLLDKQVICPDISELMGAYGAALTARDSHRVSGQQASNFVGLGHHQEVGASQKRLIHCHGCENRCQVTKLIFPNGNIFFTGNRCERIYTNRGDRKYVGSNLPAKKIELLFDRKTAPDKAPRLTLGIPRVLTIYEKFPFWNTLFVESGIAVKLSDPSSMAIYEQGAGTIMSENICYPAKLVHGHILNLIESGVDRIFFPMMFYDECSFEDAHNSYVCPILSGYPDVIRSAIDPEHKHQRSFDCPPVNFNDHGLLRKVCLQYLEELGVPLLVRHRAFSRALKAQREYKQAVRAAGQEVLAAARSAGRFSVLLLGRPYHIDPHINHKIPEIINHFGVDVLTEDSIPISDHQTLDNRYAIKQWEYPNRIYHASRWAGQQPDIEVVQLNSFGCGPDAFCVEETRAVLTEFGKRHTVIRVDEIESPGSTRLRLRSMIEARRRDQDVRQQKYQPRKATRVYRKSDKSKPLIVPQFADLYTYPLIRPALDMGYAVELLPPSNRESVEVGLKYANNEVCYPGIIVIGDVIKAFQNGSYDPEEAVVGLWETGGQCRASCIFAACKRALVAAGYENTPLITVSTNPNTMNEQPELDLDFKRYIYYGALGTIFADAINTMIYPIAAREVHPGEALALGREYLTRLRTGELILNRENICASIRQAVAEFNRIPIQERELPKVGIVGEIYVKYNDFGNNGVSAWLTQQGIEVVMPPLLEFFSSWFVSVKEQVAANLKRPDLLWLVSGPLYRFLDGYLKDVDAALKGFRYYHPSHDIHDVAGYAREIISLNHQYGEAWMIAGGVGSLVHQGINNVLCLQPFGCIANHIVAKGVQKRMKERYPELNILFLDTDAGGSEVNFFNRMHFFVNHAKTSFYEERI